MSETDEERTEGVEEGGSSKSFGENMKDAAHDLKEDAKDAFRRNKDDKDEDDGSSESESSSGSEGSG
jgi:hypothetical protein